MKLRPYIEKLPLWVFLPFLRGRVSGFFLHDVSDHPSTMIRHLYRSPRPEEFGEIVDFLAGRFNFVPLSNIVRHYRLGEPLPPSAAFLSVDDGFSSCRHVIAPTLKRAGLPATFFLTTDVLNNAAMFAGHKMSLIIDKLWSDLKPEECFRVRMPGDEDEKLLPVSEIRKSVRRIPLHTAEGKACLDRLGRELGIDWQAHLRKEQPFLNDEDVHWLIEQDFEIGAHGVDHTKFRYLDDVEREQQVRRSVRLLCDRFGLNEVAFSFPNSAQGVDREWMRWLVESEPRLQVFVDTRGYFPNDPSVLNRVTLDRSPNSHQVEEPMGGAGVSQAIKVALIRELRRR
jgi:peptidoglycan/xylan/chitin deacetylase (PgdA/CDA1 family)